MTDVETELERLLQEAKSQIGSIQAGIMGDLVPALVALMNRADCDLPSSMALEHENSQLRDRLRAAEEKLARLRVILCEGRTF